MRGTGWLVRSQQTTTTYFKNASARPCLTNREREKERKREREKERKREREKERKREREKERKRENLSLPHPLFCLFLYIYSLQFSFELCTLLYGHRTRRFLSWARKEKKKAKQKAKTKKIVRELKEEATNQKQPS